MDIERAMAEIGDIRLQMSRTRIFRGFTTSTTLCTAGAAVAASAIQASFVGHAGSDPRRYVEFWMCVAAACLLLASAEVTRRYWRTDSSLERELTLSVAEHLIPCLLVSGLVTSVISCYAREAMWVLPGLWQVFFGLGLVQLRKFLPWMVVLVGAFYILCGLVNLSAGDSAATFAAWRMGVTFGVGQATAAWIVRRGREEGYEA